MSAVGTITDFGLSSTEQMVQDTARALFTSFADNVHIRALEESELGYDPDRWRQFVELGWPGLLIPEPLGSGGSLIDVGILLSEVGRAAYPSPLLQVSTVACLLTSLGSDVLQSEIASGEIAVLVAPLGAAQVTARDRPGGYSLHAEPVVVEWGHVADHIVVLAPSSPGTWILAVLGPRHAGVRVREARGIDNERLGVIALDGVHVDLEHAILIDDLSDAAVADALARVRLLRAAEMAGGAARTLELTAEYMLQRKQFGVQLGSFQAVQHKLADMLTHAEAAQLTTFEGLSLAALGRPVQASAAIAGFVAGRAYTRSTIEAAQLHAAIGSAKEHVLHHYFRRAKAMQVRLGTVATQLERIVDAAVLSPPPGPWQRA